MALLRAQSLEKNMQPYLADLRRDMRIPRSPGHELSTSNFSTNRVLRYAISREENSTYKTRISNIYSSSESHGGRDSFLCWVTIFRDIGFSGLSFRILTLG